MNHDYSMGLIGEWWSRMVIDIAFSFMLSFQYICLLWFASASRSQILKKTMKKFVVWSDIKANYWWDISSKQYPGIFTNFPGSAINHHWEKISSINDTFKRVIWILVNWNISTGILKRIARYPFKNTLWLICANLLRSQGLT